MPWTIGIFDGPFGVAWTAAVAVPVACLAAAADFAGAASPPPGWPARQGGEALARYLLANHLRYLVYDYAGFAGADHEAIHVLGDPSRTQWIHSEAAIILDSHHQYAELAKTRRHLYDDGKIYVLDLATPAENPESPVNAGNNP